MSSIPTAAPQKFSQGLTVKWTIDPGNDYRPAAGWALTYYFTQALDHRLMLATNNGDGRFLVTIPATATAPAVTTASFLVGAYAYEGRVAKSPDVYVVDRGWLTVEASPDASIDRRSFARRALDDIRACIAGRLPKAHIAQYAVSASGEQWTTGYVPTGADLLRVEAYFAEIVRAEDARDRQARGLPAGNRVLTEFRR